MRKSYVYILASERNGTLYIGVTSDLVKRIYEHKNNLVDGFTKTHKLHNLVYYEAFDSIEDAIVREKQLKNGSRAKKMELVCAFNPEWIDWYEKILS